MNSLGTDLKAARESKGITLAQIAAKTHISLRHLSNLEEGRYAELPGGVYNRAFLRAFADHVGLDAGAMLERYKQETASRHDKEPRLHAVAAYSPREPFRIPPLLSWGIFFVLTVAGLYFGRGWIASVFSPYFSSPASSIAAEEKDPAVLPPQPVAPQPERQVPASRTEDTTAAENMPAAFREQEVTQQPLETSPAALELQFDVVESCWVSVFSDGDNVFVKLLEPGEHRTFAADERFYVILGNAAGVNLRINGKPVKPLGEPGEVVKMLINEENLRTLIRENTLG